MLVTMLCKVSVSGKNGVFIGTYLQEIEYDMCISIRKKVLQALKFRLSKMFGDSYDCENVVFVYKGPQPLNNLMIFDDSDFDCIYRCVFRPQQFEQLGNISQSFLPLSVELTPKLVQREEDETKMKKGQGCYETTAQTEYYESSEVLSCLKSTTKSLNSLTSKVEELAAKVDRFCALDRSKIGLLPKEIIKHIDEDIKKNNKSLSSGIRALDKRVNSTVYKLISALEKQNSLKSSTSTDGNLSSAKHKKTKKNQAAESELEKQKKPSDSVAKMTGNQSKSTSESIENSSKTVAREAEKNIHSTTKSKTKKKAEKRVAAHKGRKDAQQETTLVVESVQKKASEKIQISEVLTSERKTHELPIDKTKLEESTFPPVNDSCTVRKRHAVPIKACLPASSELLSKASEVIPDVTLINPVVSQPAVPAAGANGNSEASPAPAPPLVYSEDQSKLQATVNAGPEEFDGSNASDSSFEVTSRSEFDTHLGTSVADALDILLSMGLTNEGGWLSRLIEVKRGDVIQVLRVLGASEYCLISDGDDSSQSDVSQEGLTHLSMG